MRNFWPWLLFIVCLHYWSDGVTQQVEPQQVEPQQVEPAELKSGEDPSFISMLNARLIAKAAGDRPKEVVNTIGMKLLLIPAGTFTMGAPASEKFRYENETQHQVTLTKPFYMGRTEVTQGQWKAVMETEPWKYKIWVQEGDQNAASYISWDDATEFCRRLSEKEGKTYRLPTEAEWEYACRAGTTTRFSFGDDESRLGNYAWFDGNSYAIGERYAHRVAQKLDNPFGLYDMHGNVSEWHADRYATYLSTPDTDPSDPRRGNHLLRGGSWWSSPHRVRSAERGIELYGLSFDMEAWLATCGFRVVLDF